MENNNELQRLEDIAREKKDLGSLSSEELFYELAITKKLFGSIRGRTNLFILSLKDKGYQGKSEEFLDQYCTMVSISDYLAVYQHKLNREVGRRLGLSLGKMQEIENEVLDNNKW